MAVMTEHPHVIRREDILGGEPIIKGTRTPVQAIAEQRKATKLVNALKIFATRVRELLVLFYRLPPAN